MRGSAAEASHSEERLKEYHRQQERLKAMTSGSDKIKSMSADVMIENLLKQNFVKQPTTLADSKINTVPGIPYWLDCESPDLPAVYNQLWSLVKTPTIYADTQKVSQLLLTSGLPTEILGFIWNICNRSVPGQLNKQEFCTVLALVSLAQSGYTFNNLTILNMIPAPPVPALQPKVLERFGKPFTMSNNSHDQAGHVKMGNDETVMTAMMMQPVMTAKFIDQHFYHAPVRNTAPIMMNETGKDSADIRPTSKDVFESDIREDIPKTSIFPIIGSSPTAELEDEDDFSEFHSVTLTEPGTIVKSSKNDMTVSELDDFTDFQCADIVADPLKTLVISQKKEIPKIPLPKNLSGKLSNLRTNILKISPENEKKLKVLAQSEMLSTLPESKISINNKVSTMPNISVLPGSRDVGMRLANHSLGSKSERKHQRIKHKQPAHSDEPLFPPKYSTIEELFPKCFQKNPCGSKTFVLKETKISSIESTGSESSVKFDNGNIPEILPPGKNTRKIEIPMLGTFTETTLPTQSEIPTTTTTTTTPTITSEPGSKTFELFSVEEDKYSALREVELEMKMKSTEIGNTEEGSSNTLAATDDFGEFLSAEILPPAPVIEEPNFWGEWNDTEQIPQHSDVLPDVQTLSEAVPQNTQNSDLMVNALSFDLLSLGEEDTFKTLSMTPAADQDWNELNTGKSITKDVDDDPFGFVSEMVPPTKELKPTPNYDNILVLDVADGNEQSAFPSSTNETDGNEDFGDFFTPNFESFALSDLVSGNADAIPSLELKLLPQDGNTQDSIWKKCLTACLNMIRQGLDIFKGVTSKVVLDEVFSTPEAVSYLNNLNIISQIARRVSINCEDVSYVKEDIERTWQKLVSYCNEYNIELKESEDCQTGLGMQRCNLCLGWVGHEVIDQGMTLYHPSCANFWVNCVESELPPCLV